MGSVNWTSLLAGFLTVVSSLSIAMGKPALGAAIADPSVATALTGVVAGVTGLWSAFAPAVLHSTTTAAATAIKAAGK